MPESQNPSQGYAGPERRRAYFPRRLRSVHRDALVIDLPNGDRRSGGDRRRGAGRDEPVMPGA